MICYDNEKLTTQQRIHMKLLTLLVTVLLVTACGKKADFDGRNTPNDPVGNDPVGVNELTLKSVQTIEASIKYTETSMDVYSASRQVGSLPIVDLAVKIPQELIVVKGWAGLRDTAVITLLKNNAVTLTCTYTSQATVSNDDVSNTHEEYQRGMKYVFSSCSDSSTDPSDYVSNADRMKLTLNSADKLQSTETKVEADFKIYE